MALSIVGVPLERITSLESPRLETREDERNFGKDIKRLINLH